MILLDTHVWVWWANNDARLSTRHKRLILQHAATGIGLSAISTWEFAMLEARGRLVLSQSPQAQSAQAWLQAALSLGIGFNGVEDLNCSLW